MEWIVVASAREARILEKTTGNKLHQIKMIRNPLGREHNRAMTTDKPGMNRGKSFPRSEPHLLRKLRLLMGKKEIEGLELKWINKDLQNFSIEEISHHLKKYDSRSIYQEENRL